MHAHVADDRRGGVFALVEIAAALAPAFRRLGLQGIRRLDHAERRFVERVAAELGVARGVFVRGERHLRIFVALGMGEARGVDRRVRPDLAVGVGRGGGLAAAGVVLRLLVLLLLPQIHLDGAVDRDLVVEAQGEIGVLDRAGGLRLAHDMHELAFVAGRDGVGGRFDDRAGGFAEAADRLHRAAFIPGQQDDGADHQNRTQQNSDEGIHDPREEPLRRTCGVDVRHGRPLICPAPRLANKSRQDHGEARAGTLTSGP